MLLLEQDTIRKGQVDNKALPKLKKDMEFEIGGDKKYEIEIIINNMMYS